MDVKDNTDKTIKSGAMEIQLEQDLHKTNPHSEYNHRPDVICDAGKTLAEPYHL